MPFVCWGSKTRWAKNTLLLRRYPRPYPRFLQPPSHPRPRPLIQSAIVITYSHIGSHHVNHNEDALVVEDLTDRHLLLAVMDGCGAGTDSHFAATLAAKLLRKIARQTNQRTFAERRQPTTSELLKETLRNLFADLRRLNAELGLKYDELLTTLVLAVVDRHGPRAEVLTVGDGLIHCDGEIQEYDHDNKPDYLGYHLREDFDDWFNVQPQRLVCEYFLDFALATDGLLSFRPFSHDSYRPVTDDELLEFLFTARDEGEPETLYRRLIGHVKSEFGLEATDDVTVVRYLV